MKPIPNMPRVREFKAGQWLGRFPEDDSKVLAYGYSFYPPGRGNGAFRRTYSSSTVYVFATIEEWPHGAEAPTKTVILPETPIGKARLVREADKIGRKGVRDLVRPALASFFNKLNGSDEAC